MLVDHEAAFVQTTFMHSLLRCGWEEWSTSPAPWREGRDHDHGLRGTHVRIASRSHRHDLGCSQRDLGAFEVSLDKPVDVFMECL